MAHWHFQKGRAMATCQPWMGNTRLDAKWEGHPPPGDAAVISFGEAWGILLRAGKRDKAWKWQATWQKRDSKNFGRTGSWVWISAPLFADSVTSGSLHSLGQWKLLYSIVMGVSDIIYECLEHSEWSVEPNYCWSCLGHPNNKVHQKFV